MEYRLLDNETPYCGRELRPGWVNEHAGLDGDAAAAFIGPCHVANEDLVDTEDRDAGFFIEAASMAHVIVEHPGCALRIAVLRQRLLVCLLCELLAERGVSVRRDGDDVYVDDRKLTVSIAAPSDDDGSLIHLGINVDATGAPVAATGLATLGVEPRALLTDLLDKYQHEIESCTHAEGKVRTVQR